MIEMTTFRKEEEKKMMMENLITAYELRAAIMEERRNRERELQEMAVQDVSPHIISF